MRYVKSYSCSGNCIVNECLDRVQQVLEGGVEVRIIAQGLEAREPTSFRCPVGVFAFLGTFGDQHEHHYIDFIKIYQEHNTYFLTGNYHRSKEQHEQHWSQDDPQQRHVGNFCSFVWTWRQTMPKCANILEFYPVFPFISSLAKSFVFSLFFYCMHPLRNCLQSSVATFPSLQAFAALSDAQKITGCCSQMEHC